MTTDSRVIFAVTVFIGLIALGAGVGIFVLALRGQEAPDALQAIGTTALGGLVGLLAKTSSHTDPGDTPQPVTIEQGANNPVPTAEVKPSATDPATDKALNLSEQQA